MNFNHLLNQVLNVAKNEVTKTMGSNSTASTIAKAGGASAAIGLLSMVLGRKGGANLTKLGSLAALGSLAYQAYQTYQQNQAQSAGQIQENRFAQSAEEQSQLILQVMIAAAIADGEISDEEKQVIQREVGNDLALSQWIEQAINQPISIDEIAAQVGGDSALAAQVYLAARMVCADLARKEIIFLANLADALSLDEALVEQLEKQAGF